MTLEKIPYRPLGHPFWVVFFLLAGVVLAQLGVVGWYLHYGGAPDSNVGVVAMVGADNADREGVFATFYRSNDFRRPFRAEVLSRDFSFRTEHEWAHLPPGPLSARFSGFIRVPRAGKYRFFVDANDGARIRVGDHLIFDDWNATAIHHNAGEWELPEGMVPLRVEWYNQTGNGWLGLQWKGPGFGQHFVPVKVLRPDPHAGVSVK